MDLGFEQRWSDYSNLALKYHLTLTAAPPGGGGEGGGGDSSGGGWWWR